MAKIIKLTQDKEAIVDDDDFEKLSKYKWHFNKKNKTDFGYAQRGQHIKLSYKQYKNKTVYMHREILNTDLEIDHINGNTLDNRKENLRPASRIEQMQNKGSQKNSTSKFVGVHLHKLTGKWRSQMRVNGKRIDLGLFSSPEEARDIRLKYIENNELERFRR